MELSLFPLAGSLSLTSRLVKTLLYNFIRQEKSPPPDTHLFQSQAEGGGILYGLASGVASECVHTYISLVCVCLYVCLSVCVCVSVSVCTVCLCVHTYI